MGLRLWWRVARSNVPAKWKPVLCALAVIAKDHAERGGIRYQPSTPVGGIWVRVETLAPLVGQHPVTVSRVLAALDRAGLVVVERRGGRWTGKRGKVVGRATSRVLNIAAVEAFGLSDVATWSEDLVAASLDGGLGPPSDVATHKNRSDKGKPVKERDRQQEPAAVVAPTQVEGKPSVRRSSPSATRTRLDALVANRKPKKEEVPQ